MNYLWHSIYTENNLFLRVKLIIYIHILNKFIKISTQQNILLNFQNGQEYSLLIFLLWHPARSCEHCNELLGSKTERHELLPWLFCSIQSGSYLNLRYQRTGVMFTKWFTNFLGKNRLILTISVSDNFKNTLKSLPHRKFSCHPTKHGPMKLLCQFFQFQYHFPHGKDKHNFQYLHDWSLLEK